MQKLPTVQIPESDRFIATATGQDLPIWMESNAGDLARMSTECM
jgi:hypothetical protein